MDIAGGLHFRGEEKKKATGLKAKPLKDLGVRSTYTQIIPHKQEKVKENGVFKRRSELDKEIKLTTNHGV